jgi:hypothetical protein
MATTEQIAGSVARVEDTLILNRGSEHGVEPGMIFAVLSDSGDPIIDPKTGEEIGRLPREKLRVKVFDCIRSTPAQKPSARTPLRESSH